MGERASVGGPYPCLGFDPVPGNPGEISALQKQVAKAAKSLGTAHELVDRLLRSAASWEGEGGEAFRRALSQDLPRRLLDAHQSLSKASSALGRWHDGVVDRRVTAQGYEERARGAASALADAEARASDDPKGVETARDAVGDVVRLARELEGVHREAAEGVARDLEGADDGLAPEEPGVLDKVTSWLDENLGDGLAVLASAAAVAAVFAAPPVGIAIAMAVASTSSAGAFALHLRDPSIREGLKRGCQGKFDAKFWESTVTLAGDGLGALPVVGLATHGAKGAVAAVRAASAADDAAVAVGRAGAEGFEAGAKDAATRMAGIENPLSRWALHSVGANTKTAVEAGVAGTGVMTSAAEFTNAEDNELFGVGATGLDGARAAADDAPSNIARLLRSGASL